MPPVHGDEIVALPLLILRMVLTDERSSNPNRTEERERTARAAAATAPTLQPEPEVSKPSLRTTSSELSRETEVLTPRVTCTARKPATTALAAPTATSNLPSHSVAGVGMRGRKPFSAYTYVLVAASRSRRPSKVGVCHRLTFV